MFASSDGERTRIAVTLTLASGAAVTGHVFAGMTGKLRDVINHADRYLEFENREGAIIYILKDDIRSASPFELPRSDQLERRLRDAAIFDPWRILGVERTAGPVEIRTAYWARAKQYHPDKFVDTDAPKEVCDFMNAMFTRVHAAYKELSGEAAP